MKIKSGCSRLVLLVQYLHLAIKIPLNREGIRGNWSEFRFYHKTRNPLLQPTYVSFFGLLNVQLLGHDVGIDTLTLKRLILRVVGTDVSGFTHPPAKFLRGLSKFLDRTERHATDNWSLSPEGKLTILDYADRRTQQLVLFHGKILAEEFTTNPPDNESRRREPGYKRMQARFQDRWDGT